MQAMRGYQQNANEGKDRDFLVIAPDHSGRVAWDLFCMAIIVYELIMIPMLISFEPLSPSSFSVMDSLSPYEDIIFMTDIFLNFNTACYREGVLVYRRKIIAWTYIKLWFWLDLVSSFPYEELLELIYGSGGSTTTVTESDPSNPGFNYTTTIETSSSGSTASSLNQGAEILTLVKFFRFIKVLRLLRVAKLRLIVEKIIEYLRLSNTVIGMLGFVRLCVIVMFIAHWLGCFWHLIGQTNSNESWLVKYGIVDEDWVVKYVASIYWSITTMITVGYGDIVPVRIDEQVYAMFVMVFACGVFAYTMNTMGTMLQQIDSFSEEFKNEMIAVNRYLKNKQIPMDMQMRIRKYLEYIYERSEQSQIDESNLLGKLSSSLKNDLIVQINSRIVESCLLFKEQDFSERLLYQLTLVLQEKIVIPEEDIFVEQQLEYEEKCLFFIQEGQVEIYMKSCMTLLQILESGKYFGEISFFTDQPRSASARSADFTNLFFLRRSELVQMLKRYPADQERFFLIKDKISLYGDYTDLEIVCYCCNEKGHTAHNCSQISFFLQRNKYFETLLKQRRALEAEFRRSERRKWRTLKQRLFLQEMAHRLFNDENVPVEDYCEQYELGDEEVHSVHEIKQFISRQGTRDATYIVQEDKDLAKTTTNGDASSKHRKPFISNLISSTGSSQGIDGNIAGAAAVFEPSPKNDNSAELKGINNNIFGFENEELTDHLTPEDAEQLMQEKKLALKKKEELSILKYYEFLELFDKMKIFDIYFPHNNVSCLFTAKNLSIEEEEMVNSDGAFKEKNEDLNNRNKEAADSNEDTPLNAFPADGLKLLEGSVLNSPANAEEIAINSEAEASTFDLKNKPALMRWAKKLTDKIAENRLKEAEEEEEDEENY